jgi:ligand-binding sensor domain-containing protein/signal transduction histidine kinase
LTKKSFLPLELVFFLVFTGLFATRPSLVRALQPGVPQQQFLKVPTSGLQVSSVVSSPQSQSIHQQSRFPSRPNLRFDRLSAVDGMSFSLSTSIVQDQQGFMWFGTRYGLDKFDGYNFTIFILEAKNDVLFSNYVTDLYQDRTGDLWISTLTDLVRKDHKSGEFVHYKAEPDNPQSLAPGRINVISEDSSGTIWIGTNGGLNRYDPATDTFTRFLQDQGIGAIFADREGGIWLGTDSGLWYYSSGSLEQQNPMHYQHDPADPTSLSNDIVIAIYEDMQGVIWVGTQYDGLNRLDDRIGKFTRYPFNPDDPTSLSSNWVNAILEDEGGWLWVATNNGLNLLDRMTGRFFQYHFDPNDAHSLSSEEVRDIYQDRSGVVWVATNGGVCKLNETASHFTHYQQGPNQSSLVASLPGNLPNLSDNLITSIYQDSHGILWIGTSLGGLNQLDRSSGSVKIYRHDPADSTSLGFGEVFAVYEDQTGMLWVGTNSGLQRFDAQTGTFIDEEVFRGQTVSAIAEDQQGSLWIGYWGGLLRRESGASDFSPVPIVGELFAAGRVQGVYPDRSGAVWISTQNNGLFRLNLGVETAESTTRIIRYPQDSSDPRSPGISPVMNFYEDSQGTLWMASVDDGLLRFDRNTQTFSHYLPTTGIAKYVSCIQGDAQGFLWMGTALGLARFDPRTEKFSYFDARDGLQVGEGLRCFQNEQGEMFFGSFQGLNTFFPDQIQDNPNPPVVVITALNLRNHVLRTDLLPDEQIKLSYRENYLSFDFAALDYAAPAKNQYAYKMEGLEADWIEAGARRHADYPDLKPGTYTFRVKASNNSGIWNELGTSVVITITSPFWQTWWFFGLMGLGLVGVIAGGFRLRLKGLEARSRDLERQVSERTGALEQKTLELQQHTEEIERRRQELEALLLENARLHQQSQELAVLEERSRLARELHDAVTQTLFSASLVAEALPTTWEKDPREGHRLLQELRGLSRGALAEMRTLLLELRPAALLETSLEDLIRQLGEAASGREGIPVSVQVEGLALSSISPLPPDVHISLYRITQEALNNVVKHARAHQVTVRLCYSNEDQTVSSQTIGGEQPVELRLSILLSIRDDGRGFDPENISHQRLGLGIMQERAKAIGANLTIKSLPGHGTKVTVLWKQEKRREAK